MSGLPKLPFRGQAPDRQNDVMQQYAWYDSAVWKKDLDDPDSCWPSFLDELEVKSRKDGRGWRKVSRRNVFDFAKTVGSTEGAVQLLVASMVWGIGTSAQSRRRHLKVLSPFVKDGELDKLGKTLLDAIGQARKVSPVAAYAVLHGKEPGEGSLKVDYLGPSYGTKLLYFATFEKHSAKLPALILDRRVATALTWLTGTPWAEHGWSSATYEAYLRTCVKWAEVWKTEPDGVEPTGSRTARTWRRSGRPRCTSPSRSGFSSSSFSWRTPVSPSSSGAKR